MNNEFGTKKQTDTCTQPYPSCMSRLPRCAHARLGGLGRHPHTQHDLLTEHHMSLVCAYSLAECDMADNCKMHAPAHWPDMRCRAVLLNAAQLSHLPAPTKYMPGWLLENNSDEYKSRCKILPCDAKSRAHVVAGTRCTVWQRELRHIPHCPPLLHSSSVICNGWTLRSLIPHLKPQHNQVACRLHTHTACGSRAAVSVGARFEKITNLMESKQHLAKA